MTTVDANRIAFVKQAYRYADSSDPAVLARNPDAVLVRMDTNLSYDAAVVRAQNELDANKGARVFDVEVAALLFFDDFVNGPPAFSFTSERHQVTNRAMRVVGFTSDTNTGRTIMRLRG